MPCQIYSFFLIYNDDEHILFVQLEEDIMDDKKIIGMKMNKKGVVINFVILLIHTGVWTFMGIYMCLGNFLNLDYDTRVYLLVLATFILLIIQLPMIGATQRIEYSDEMIELYSIRGYINQFKEVIHILMDKSADAAISIFIKEIDTVKLSYRKTYGGYGITGYALVLLFLMKNGTVISLSPENMSKTENGAYFCLLNMLEKNDVKITDQLNLKAGLIKDSKYFQNYVKNISDRSMEND